MLDQARNTSLEPFLGRGLIEPSSQEWLSAPHEFYLFCKKWDDKSTSSTRQPGWGGHPTIAGISNLCFFLLFPLIHTAKKGENGLMAKMRGKSERSESEFPAATNKSRKCIERDKVSVFICVFVYLCKVSAFLFNGKVVIFFWKKL